MNTEPQTPKVDQNIKTTDWITGCPVVSADFARQLERELTSANARIVELEQALTGRTVSCAACNASSAERDRWRSCAEKVHTALSILSLSVKATNGYIQRDLLKTEVEQADAALAEYTRCLEADPRAGHPFLEQMTHEIQSNAQKGDWNTWWPSTIEIDHEIRHHTAKLLSVIQTGDRAKIREFSADIANIAHRAFDTFGYDMPADYRPVSPLPPAPATSTK